MILFAYDGASADRLLQVTGRMLVGPKETAHQVSLGSLVPRRKPDLEYGLCNDWSRWCGNRKILAIIPEARNRLPLASDCWYGARSYYGTSWISGTAFNSGSIRPTSEMMF